MNLAIELECTWQDRLDEPCDRTGSLNRRDIASPPPLHNIGSTDSGIPPTVFPTGTCDPDHEALEDRYNKLCGRTDDEALQHQFYQLCPNQKTLRRRCHRNQWNHKNNTGGTRNRGDIDSDEYGLPSISPQGPQLYTRVQGPVSRTERSLAAEIKSQPWQRCHRNQSNQKNNTEIMNMVSKGYIDTLLVRSING